MMGSCRGRGVEFVADKRRQLLHPMFWGLAKITRSMPSAGTLTGPLQRFLCCCCSVQPSLHHDSLYTHRSCGMLVGEHTLSAPVHASFSVSTLRVAGG